MMDEVEDELSRRLRQEALEAMEEEPQLTMLLKNTILAPGVVTFEDAVASTITYRLLQKPCNSDPTSVVLDSSSSSSSTLMFCPNSLRGILADALQSTTILEAGHTMAEAVRLDALAVCDRDPAVDSVLEVVLFMKGFAALVCHRAAYHKWYTARNNKKKKSMVALWLQSQASAVFGLDIHPAATMGAGIMLDHGTGIVIGETATVGDGCTLLHGVTLGGTGKESGDRHPKVGKYVLIGANASLLGNIHIGDRAKIGAGSIVLGPIPSGATAVGAPAKIVGRAKEAKPASVMDETLQQVSHLHKSTSSATVSTAGMTSNPSSTSMVSLVAISDESSEKEEDWEVTDDDEQQQEQSTTTTNNNNKKDTTTTIEDKKEPDKMVEGNHSHKNKMKIKRIDSANLTNVCCPFRDYVVLAQSAPTDGITIVTLRRWLGPLGCTADEIGEVLFALDTRNVGYVKPHVFFTKETESVMVIKTRLSLEQVQKVLAEGLRQWQTQKQFKTTMKESTNGGGVQNLIPAAQRVSAAC